MFKLSIQVNYNEEQQNETLFVSVVNNVCSTPKKKPSRLEPLFEEIESSDNTPSYEFRDVYILLYL